LQLRLDLGEAIGEAARDLFGLVNARQELLFLVFELLDLLQQIANRRITGELRSKAGVLRFDDGDLLSQTVVFAHELLGELRSALEEGVDEFVALGFELRPDFTRRSIALSGPARLLLRHLGLSPI